MENAPKMWNVTVKPTWQSTICVHLWRLFSSGVSHTAWKVSKYGFISGPYYPDPALRIQSEYRKIRTKNNSVFGHFSRSALFTTRFSTSFSTIFSTIFENIKKWCISTFFNNDWPKNYYPPSIKKIALSILHKFL